MRCSRYVCVAQENFVTIAMGNTHDWSINKPKNANIQKAVNCMIVVSRLTTFLKLIFQTMKICFKSLPKSCFPFVSVKFFQDLSGSF